MRDVLTADRILDVIDDTPRSSGDIMRRLGYQSWNLEVDLIIRGTLWAHGLVRLTDLGWVRVRRNRF